MGKGGGGQQQQQPTSSTVTQTNLPAYAQPYVEKLFGQAGALTDINQNPYQQYGGQRLADFTPMQQQAFNTTSNMQVSPQNQQATGLAGMAGLGSLGAGQQYNQMATNPYATQAFMSPYQQNVTDFQKQQAVMDYNRGAPAAGAAASRAGAFGGSRQAIVEGEGQRNLQNQLAGIQATGSQNAFQNAQQAMQYGAGLGMQGYGQALQGASTLGQLGQNQYAQQMGINAAQQQAGAQQQAFNQQGLSNQYQDFLNRQNYPYQQLGFMSDIIRGNTTGGITTTQNSQVAPSMFSQIAGSLGGLGSLAGAYNAFGKAEGGEIKSYAEGGLASLTEPETELAAKSKLPPTTTAEALAKFMLPVINRMHQPAAQPGTTTVAEDMAREILSRGQPQQPQEPQQLEEPQEPQGQEPQQGMSPPEGMADGGIASLPVQNFNPDNYAGGGIIAFGEPDGEQEVKAPKPSTTAEKKREAYDYFIGQGWKPEAAAGIVSNIHAESNFNPKALHDKNPKTGEFAGVGIVGWQKDRRQQLEETYGKNPTYQQQLEFLNDELNGKGDKGAAKAGNLLRNISSPTEAGSILSRIGIRPQAVQEQAISRGKLAETFYRDFGGNQNTNIAAAPEQLAPRPDYVVPKEGIASQILSAVTGSGSAQAADTAPEQPSGDSGITGDDVAGGAAATALGAKVALDRLNAPRIAAANAYQAGVAAGVPTSAPPKPPISVAGGLKSLANKIAPTTLAKGLPPSLLGAAGTLAIPGLAALDTYNTPTEDYYKRFAINPPEGSGIGSLAKDVGVRGLGFASDLANTFTLGNASKWFGYRDKQEPTPQQDYTRKPAAPAVPAAPAAAPATTTDRVSGYDVPSQERPSAIPADAVAAKKPQLIDELQDYLMKDIRGESSKVPTEKEFNSRMDSFAKANGTDPESTKKFFDQQASSLADQAAEAKKARNVNMWMAAASGFFAMGAGKSPNALQNFAAGAGIGVAQANEVAKEYSAAQRDVNKAKMELTRMDLTDRRAMTTQQENKYLQYQAMIERGEDRKRATVATVYNAQLTRDQTKELRKNNQLLEARKQDEVERRNAEEAFVKRNKLWVDAKSKDPSLAIAEMQANSTDPKQAKETAAAKALLDRKAKEIFGASGMSTPPDRGLRISPEQAALLAKYE